MSYAHEHDFDPLIDDATQRLGVPAPLIRAVIAHESQWNPRAYRQEPTDASRGLMQILLATARGLGFSGDAGPTSSAVLATGTFALTGLFDPATNIGLGVRLLRDLLARTQGDIPAALSAYNGGMRPALAFGVRATVAGRVCLAKNPDGTCARWYSYGVGQFGNQPYVDAVMDLFQSYGGTWPPAAPIPPAPALPALPDLGSLDLSRSVADGLAQVEESHEAVHTSVSVLVYVMFGVLVLGLIIFGVLAGGK